MALTIFLGTVTNNNLLFLLFSAMLALMVLSGILSERTIRNLELDCSFPERIFARADAVITYRIRNCGRRHSGYLVQGPRVAAFEQAVAEYVGTKYAVAVTSCTAATPTPASGRKSCWGSGGCAR
jgi:uncharacterized protein (DUF58 family)